MFYKLLAVVLLAAQVSTADIDVENNLSEKFKISGYIDARFTGWGLYNTIPSREFSIRRSGCEINARFTEAVEAELKIEARPDELFLKNAVISWDPADWARIRGGQFKRETLLGGELSTWSLNMFERPLVYDLCENLTYAGRDMGLDLRVDIPAFSGMELRGTAGVFNGDERGDQREDNELLYTMRGEILFPSIDLTLGASAATHRQGESDPVEPSGYSLSARQNAFAADISIDYEISNWYDITAAAEAVTGDNWDEVNVIAGEEAPSFTGLWGSLTASYHPWNVQGIKTVSLAVSYDTVTPNTDWDSEDSRVSVIGAIYPSNNIRLRFGGVMNKNSMVVAGIPVEENYTDFIVEAGIRF
ncbi:MAG: hypothetical protein U9P42_06415 [Candidatus Fermentibacteria bacterium]|nr:hypothetical protein [Candidatus Fermentibacteria bacterium]